MNNLRFIEGAKDQWVLENKKEIGAMPTVFDLAPYLNGGRIQTSRVKETYSFNPVGMPASAITPVKLGTYAAGSTIRAND